MTQYHQPFACLIAVDPETARITHVSETCHDILGLEAPQILNANMRDLLGVELWHGLRNAASNPAFTGSAVAVAGVGDLGTSHNVRAFASDRLYVVEVFPKHAPEFGSTATIDIAQAVMSQLLPQELTLGLAEQLATLLRHFTGSDHVLIWNRQSADMALCIAESKRRSRDSALQEMAHWADLWPSDTGTIGVIADAQAGPVPLLATADQPACDVDLSLALSRTPASDAVSRLAQTGQQSSVTLRLSRNGAPWGVIECQSARHRVPSAELMALCNVLLPFLDAKLQLLGRA